MTRWILTVSLLAALSACSHRASPERNETTTNAGPAIYPLAVSLVDQRGAHMGLDVHRGHPVIVSMFYGSCPTACPLIVSHVKEVEAQLPPADRDDVRILLISFDPANDTPAALTKIARMRGLDPARWTLATGTDDDVRQIAAVLGVTYRRLPEGGFAHDSVLTVLDREGRVIARVDDPSATLLPLVTALRDDVSSRR